jgi:beta-galactosidase/beta-glucuronidase
VRQDDVLHPRPQLTRQRWTDLCGPWGFAYDDAQVGLDEGWQAREDVFDRTIEVPFPPESPASGIADTGFHPVVWYRRTFRTEDADLRPGERLLLHLGAVDYRASVWVNGVLVVTHEGGHTPFSADVTPALLPAGDQVVTVRAEDLPEDLTQPRGKQDWRERPHEIWYERTTGIWQPVWLEPVPAVRIDRVAWEPDLHRSVLRLRVTLAGTAASSSTLRVGLRLTLHGEVIADDVYAVTGGVLQRDLPLDGARIHFDRRRYLWSPKHPNLLQAELTLLGRAAAPDGAPAQDEAVVDRVGSYCGLRSISTSGGRFVLNGRAFVLRMVLAQNYWPESHLAAPSPAALRREVELVKELGFNGVRIHQKVEDPRFLAECDRLGVVAWGELPSTLDFDPVTVRRLAAEWTEVLERDRSSPALVAWVPFNESWGIPNMEDDERQRDAVRALYHLTRAIDPTRPVIGNDGWEHLVSDVFGVHDYSPSGELLRERYGSHEALERTLGQVQPFYRSLTLPGVAREGQPLMVTEFGGITYDPQSQDFWNGYGAVGSADELLARYEELVSALLASPVVAGFCYTQLTDTAQERNGLLDEQRRPKADVARIAAANRLDSAAVPADAIMEIQIVHAARNQEAAGG